MRRAPAAGVRWASRTGLALGPAVVGLAIVWLAWGRFLSERGAAVLVPQRELTPQRLAELLRGFTREALLDMAQRARSAAKPDATRAVAQVCMELAA